LHLPDGYLDPSLCVLMYALALAGLYWAWRGVGRTFHRSFVSVIAVSSAFVFAAQMLNFTVPFGTSGHLVGGTFLASLLGPQAAVISMTIVLIVQAVIFADGGLTTLGANIFNMAIIGAFSYYIVALIVRGHAKRLALGVFLASWFSVVLGGLAAGVEIGTSSIFAPYGGLSVTVPSMLFWHLLIGLGEATITTVLVAQLLRSRPTSLFGLNKLVMINERNH